MSNSKEIKSLDYKNNYRVFVSTISGRRTRVSVMAPVNGQSVRNKNCGTPAFQAEYDNWNSIPDEDFTEISVIIGSDSMAAAELLESVENEQTTENSLRGLSAETKKYQISLINEIIEAFGEEFKIPNNLNDMDAWNKFTETLSSDGYTVDEMNRQDALLKILSPMVADRTK